VLCGGATPLRLPFASGLCCHAAAPVRVGQAVVPPYAAGQREPRAIMRGRRLPGSSAPGPPAGR
jgi:hypothetical protein